LGGGKKKKRYAIAASLNLQILFFHQLFGRGRGKRKKIWGKKRGRARVTSSCFSFSESMWKRKKKERRRGLGEKKEGGWARLPRVVAALRELGQKGKKRREGAGRERKGKEGKPFVRIDLPGFHSFRGRGGKERGRKSGAKGKRGGKKRGDRYNDIIELICHTYSAEAPQEGERKKKEVRKTDLQEKRKKEKGAAIK